MLLNRTIAILIGAACLQACAPGPRPAVLTAPVAAPAGSLAIAGVAFGPDEITDAKVAFTPWGAPVIQIDFTPEGRSRFSGVQAGRVGQALPFVLDGRVLSAPILREPVDGDMIQISGSFTVEEAKNLARRIGERKP
jgi:preprotein translocase subunit SecD